MEKKGYTLVSCLGRPKKGMTADSSYVITKYRFDDGSIIDKSIAASALIDYYRKEIKKAIIVGTKTSSWDALFPEECINDLWDKVEKESKVGISNETLKELEKELSRIFGFEFALIALPTELDAKNIKEINEAYSTINDKILKHTKLMIDITNGFRYIPMMLFQILQLRSAEYNIGEVKMFYGELQETPSQMRDVSSLWISAEINKQLYAFESAFDGDRLAETLIKSGGCGASIGNWIKGFTRIIKSNYVYDIQNQISLL